MEAMNAKEKTILAQGQAAIESSLAILQHNNQPEPYHNILSHLPLLGNIGAIVMFYRTDILPHELSPRRHIPRAPHHSGTPLLHPPLRLHHQVPHLPHRVARLRLLLLLLPPRLLPHAHLLRHLPPSASSSSPQPWHTTKPSGNPTAPKCLS